MLIKLNGLPWDDIQTPDMSGFTFPNTAALVDPYSVTESLLAKVHYLNQLNYFVLSQTDVTEQVYKFSGWSIGEIVKFTTRIL